MIQAGAKVNDLRYTFKLKANREVLLLLYKNQQNNILQIKDPLGICLKFGHGIETYKLFVEAGVIKDFVLDSYFLN
jgi:hypothetical protein